MIRNPNLCSPLRSSADKMSMAKKAFSRLPRAIRPIKYHLRLKPDLAAFTFRGWMKVELDVAEATDTIVCNAAELGWPDITQPF